MTAGRRRARRSRSGGYLIALAVALGSGVIGTAVLGHTYSRLALQKEPFQRLRYVPSFDPVEDVTLGLPPDASDQDPGWASGAIRAIVVYPTQTIMLAGGKALRTINQPAPGTLRGLARLVHNPRWVNVSGSTVTIRAAVVIEGGSVMTIAAPVTSELVMAVRPGVFLATVHGRLRLSGVYVHASDSRVPDVLSRSAGVRRRPFLFANDHSTLTAAHCVFRYLGRDWNSSYGLTWSKESTGYVIRSEFDHDFIGVYLNGSSGLRIAHNRFYRNTLYGIDPHSSSSHLTIEHNTSDFNGRHGIILSDHVTDSVIRYNVTRGNGFNGIMMDQASAHNSIEHNTVMDSKSGGIVLAGSGGNTVADNTVRNNRVGIIVRGPSYGTMIRGNTVSGNEMAAQGTGLSRNTVYGNGGAWSARLLRVIWLCALGLLMLLLAVTRIFMRTGAGQ